MVTTALVLSGIKCVLVGYKELPVKKTSGGPSLFITQSASLGEEGVG